MQFSETSDSGICTMERKIPVMPVVYHSCQNKREVYVGISFSWKFRSASVYSVYLAGPL